MLAMRYELLTQLHGQMGLYALSARLINLIFVGSGQQGDEQAVSVDASLRHWS
jgi:hypothetical protein